MQKAGHKPIALIGGATGMIGDPSGKSEERNLLNEETLDKNINGIKNQLVRYLNFDASSPNAAELVNNYDWFKPISFIDFLRDVGKHITVNYMMAKESVRKRIEGEIGISYTEFAYQLMQGYDFLWLYQNKNCKLQFGGSDQWGNMTTGAELVRRKAGGEAFVFTNPLITKSDGGKFGKTEKGNIWLNATKTTPYQFYQFWLNATDADAEKWIRIFTFLTQNEISSLVKEHELDASKRIVQKKLAEEVTKFVHGEEEFLKAVNTTQKLFDQQHASAESLSIEDLESMEGIVKVKFEKSILESGVEIINFLADTMILPSKGEARKMVQNSGISINRKKVETQELKINTSHLLHEKFILVQKGKKNYYLVEAV
jgi:tyrosyl-tRNA synthetase